MTTHVLKFATDQCVCEEFVEKLLFKGDHYEVSLPWKATHPPLPENYELMSRRRLQGLLSLLRKKLDILKEYDCGLKDQIERGIVQVVNEVTKPDVVHYIPHHAVIRRDKSTTRLRIVYDASAKSDGASLNDCLHAGPVLTQSIWVDDSDKGEPKVITMRFTRVCFDFLQAHSYWMPQLNTT